MVRTKGLWRTRIMIEERGTVIPLRRRFRTRRTTRRPDILAIRWDQERPRRTMNVERKRKGIQKVTTITWILSNAAQ
jgi:hypothetical protein